MPEKPSRRPTTGRHALPANGPLVRQLRENSCLSLADFASATDLDEKTLRRIEQGGNAYPSSLRRVAEILKVPVETIILQPLNNQNCDTVPIPTGGAFWRNLSGSWRLCGADLVVPEHFDYKIPPKSFGGELELKQSGHVLRGEGQDQDGDRLSFDGELLSPDHIRGEYRIENDRMHAVGCMMGVYQGDGRTIRGFYLGRDTGHGVPLILGTLTLTHVDGKRD